MLLLVRICPLYNCGLPLFRAAAAFFAIAPERSRWRVLHLNGALLTLPFDRHYAHIYLMVIIARLPAKEVPQVEVALS
jgi:hypothetical protein